MIQCPLCGAETEEREPLYGFKVSVWQGVFHNGRFSHHATRHVTVHARSATEAKAAITLEPGRTARVGEDFVVHTEDEWIYGVQSLGRVSYRTTPVYGEED